ncbi:MAG: HK97-gp10 family putative phage morphogenesis protein [Solimonas sp.]
MGVSTQKIDGLPELLAAMRQLPREIVSKNGGPLRRALAKAARVIRDEAQNLAPVRTGLLRKEIRAIRMRRPDEVGATEAYLVGVRRGKATYSNTRDNRRKGRAGKTYQTAGNAFYWRWLEFGTARLAAMPFLRPAFEARKNEAASTLANTLKQGIAAAVRKLGRVARP